MELEVGKRYIRRDGSISGVIVNNTANNKEEYPFEDSLTTRTYTKEGLMYEDNHQHHADLVAEYNTEPKLIESDTPTDKYRMVVEDEVADNATEEYTPRYYYEDPYRPQKVINGTKAYSRFTYETEFDKVVIELNHSDMTLDDAARVFRQFLLAMSFTPEQINEMFPYE